MNTMTTFWKIDETYFVRTVTHYCVGRLIEISDKELVFADASWVADCGRFNNALKVGKLEEVEPFVHPVLLNRSSIIDATIWGHPLPTEVI